jgi:hypothetical protein
MPANPRLQRTALRAAFDAQRRASSANNGHRRKARRDLSGFQLQ